MLIKFLTSMLSVLAPAYCTCHTGVWTPPPPTSICPMQAHKHGRNFPPLTACATATAILKQRQIIPSKSISPRGRRCCLSVLPLMSSLPCLASRVHYTKDYHGCTQFSPISTRIQPFFNAILTSLCGKGENPRFEAAKKQYDDRRQECLSSARPSGRLFLRYLKGTPQHSHG